MLYQNCLTAHRQIYAIIIYSKFGVKYYKRSNKLIAVIINERIQISESGNTDSDQLVSIFFR